MPVYVYECLAEHQSDHFFSVAEMPQSVKCPTPRCGRRATRVITLPAIHTLGTFSKDIDDHDVQATRDPGDGSYLDPTLSYCPTTGKVLTPVKSAKHRRELMAARGLEEKAPSDKAKDVALAKRRQRKTFTGVGSRA